MLKASCLPDPSIVLAPHRCSCSVTSFWWIHRRAEIEVKGDPIFSSPQSQDLFPSHRHRHRLGRPERLCHILLELATSLKLASIARPLRLIAASNFLATVCVVSVYDILLC
jgi:hypothetical protein